MMSKERLEEIEERFYKTGYEINTASPEPQQIHADLQYLIYTVREQAEQVQELENTIKAFDHSKTLSATVAGKNHNLRIQNKRYREAVGNAEKELMDKNYPLDVHVSRALDILVGALESESE